MKRKTRVLYIVGSGRSGSTILGNIIGQIPGFFHVGELQSIWDVSLLRGKACGCGEQLAKCDVWGSVLSNVFGGYPNDKDIHLLIELKKELIRTHSVPCKILSGLVFPQEQRGEYSNVTGKLYQSIHEVTQCEWIVDSSKIPSHAYLLSELPFIELHLIHLVRDLRAVEYSWQRKAIDGFRPKFFGHALTWVVRNIVAEMMGKMNVAGYSRFKYERFAESPKQCLRELMSSIGIEGYDEPFLSDNEIDMSPTHTVHGNPNRLGNSIIRIEADDVWKSRMDQMSRKKVELISAPLLVRYGYL